jgi:hypothetical protein
MPEDVQAVEQYLEREFLTRSVAIFSCAAEKFFRAYPLAVPIKSRSESIPAYVKPLANLG